MSSDHRLADLTVLALAAKRCQARRQAPDWRTTIGMSALLAAAKALPERSPWSLPSVDEDGGGLGQLLREARQWEKEHGHGG